MNNSFAELLQSMIAPGIMISACGLLLLAMNNKYSLIVHRIRLLKEEKLSLYEKHGVNDPESNRLSNIELQISHLIHRISMVRNAVFCYSIAIALFIVSCILTGMKTSIEINSFYWIIIAFFYGGLMSVFTGTIFAVIEIWKEYRIVHLEISEIYQNLE